MRNTSMHRGGVQYLEAASSREGGTFQTTATAVGGYDGVQQNFVAGTKALHLLHTWPQILKYENIGNAIEISALQYFSVAVHCNR